jgi:hypothetical protein
MEKGLNSAVGSTCHQLLCLKISRTSTGEPAKAGKAEMVSDAVSPKKENLSPRESWTVSLSVPHSSVVFKSKLNTHLLCSLFLSMSQNDVNAIISLLLQMSGHFIQ